MKNRKQNVVAVLIKEVQALEAEEADLKRQLVSIQSVIKDVRQAIVTLQGSAVHVPLSARVFDTIQAMKRFASAGDIAETICKDDEYADVRTMKRDVNSVLNRMKKKGAVTVIEVDRIQYYGLLDWVNDRNEPLNQYKVKVA
jgi:hypothetical protein